MSKRSWTYTALAGVLLTIALTAPSFAAGNAFSGGQAASSTAASITQLPPNYSFSCTPFSIMYSYYDYLLASPNSVNLKLFPNGYGGGYYATYEGKRAATGYSRVFGIYLNSNGLPMINYEICPTYRPESSPAIAVDPVSGKTFCAWQVDVDSDSHLEVVVASDAFIALIPGLWNTPQTVIDNPVNITAPDGSVTSNDFLEANLDIGPSPIAGKRRVYLLGRNAESCYLAWADFDGNDVEDGIPLAWSCSSIPELDAWNADPDTRRIHYGLAVGPEGSVFIAGWRALDSADVDIDCFCNVNYGEGDWTRHSYSSSLPSWNPSFYPDGSNGYFVDDSGQSYLDSELNWELMNSGNVNIVLDNVGKLYIAGIWGLRNADGGFYPELQVVKEAFFNPLANSFSIKEIYPQSRFGGCYQPWDTEYPSGQVDEWLGDSVQGFHPRMKTVWPFCHWDDSAHDGNMMHYYNNVRVTKPSPSGMMAAVWQESYRARRSHVHQDPQFAQYADTPEIYIAVSENNGYTWKEPIVLNNVDTPQMAGINPMWVCPADQIIEAGISGGYYVGKLGLIFYDDFTWGANSLAPPYHANCNGGRLLFAELQIQFSDAPVEAPSMRPLPGIYHNTVQVWLSGSHSNLTIYYTTDGSVPTYQSPVYNIPIQINTCTTLRAVAVHPTMGAGPEAVGEYILGVSDVLASPPGGYFTAPVNVSLSCATDQTLIRYTLDGSEPDEGSPIYTSPIQLSSSCTLKARAYREGWQDSGILCAVFEIELANSDDTGSPAVTGLSRAWPNPGRGPLNIELGISGAKQDYTLKIYNIRGELVRGFTGNGKGWIGLQWNGDDERGRVLPGGVYILSLEAGGKRSRLKVARY